MYKQKQNMPTESSPLIPVEIVHIACQGDSTLVFLKGELPKVIPITMGLMEGQSLMVTIQKLRIGRPTIYELTENLIGKMKGTVRQLVIHCVRENTYHAYLLIETSEQPIMLDCRPSDGMVLAKYFDAPIYVTSELMDEAGRDIPPG